MAPRLPQRRRCLPPTPLTPLAVVNHSECTCLLCRVTLERKHEHAVHGSGSRRVVFGLTNTRRIHGNLTAFVSPTWCVVCQDDVISERVVELHEVFATSTQFSGRGRPSSSAFSLLRSPKGHASACLVRARFRDGTQGTKLRSDARGDLPTESQQNGLSRVQIMPCRVSCFFRFYPSCNCFRTCKQNADFLWCHVQVRCSQQAWIPNLANIGPQELMSAEYFTPRLAIFFTNERNWQGRHAIHGTGNW